MESFSDNYTKAEHEEKPKIPTNPILLAELEGIFITQWEEGESALRFGDILSKLPEKYLEPKMQEKVSRALSEIPWLDKDESMGEFKLNLGKYEEQVEYERKRKEMEAEEANITDQLKDTEVGSDEEIDYDSAPELQPPEAEQLKLLDKNNKPL